MTPGEVYVLASDPAIKVTLLETPDELRRRARVLVRFESGVSAGRVTDIPTRRVGAPNDRCKIPARTTPRSRAATVVALTRPARIGDSVTLPETGELIWTVDAIHHTTAAATISTVIFERPDTRTVDLYQLQVRVEPARGRARIPSDESPPRPPRQIDPAVEAAERLRPIAPRRELDELMEDVYFSNRCVQAYYQRFAGGSRASALDRLREEVRLKGYLLRDDPPRAGEYARVRVNTRFDIVLLRRPTPEASVTVDTLSFPARRSPRQRRPARGRDQRRAA